MKIPITICGIRKKRPIFSAAEVKNLAEKTSSASDATKIKN
jgi:hypothetical protein